MTTNLHDKMLKAIDAYFSASNEIEAHIAEEQLLDVRDEINKHKLAAESLNEGLRLDDWDKIGCVNHDCDKCKALAEQPAQQEPVAWGNLANWCLDSDRVLITDKDEAAKYHKDIYDLTPLYTAPQAQPAREPLTLPPGRCASEWGGRATGPCLYTDDEVFEILASHGITKGNT